ncbi:alpha/beta hydrolase [Streptomyces sp. MBT56]|uniref:alpha/beta fold hydrolase n=1 Tax=Streptomyces sp. MBT56 TaxID=1488387 RepID=UPI00190B1050|nr:alpha/beta hydrolase [Streptomyces sp. MBT56]MBK3559720.1 alpha/beta hydrolase [Streptomyces sp. MBT56]
MTVFILVAGAFTGPHVWRDTAARLTAEGAEVHTVALTGLGGPPADGGAAVDLETHVADVLAVIDPVIDATAEPGGKVVLVGHDYGIHPVLGAADRRARSIGRIVYLDSGLPQDGVPALAAVPDQLLREEVAERATGSGDGVMGGELPPPARDEWPRWGSTEGLSEAALDGLTALAAPQPLGTLLQPLRLTGAVAEVPATGVLCARNGPGVEMLQIMVDVGTPALRALADARVTFFELPTGHWPMLSCPDALAGTLIEAASGGGHLLTPADAGHTPAHLRPFLLDVPERPRERTGNTDLYLPDGPGPHPAVVFVHGGPVPAEAMPTPRDWPAPANYPILAPLPAWGLTGSRFHPVRALSRAGDLPVVLVRVGRESAEIAATVEEFVAEAARCGANLEIIDVPEGRHGFETLDPADGAREAVHRAVGAVLARLKG